MGAPLFMPPSLRSRVEPLDLAPTRSARAGIDTGSAAASHTRRTHRRCRHNDALVGSFALAVALAIGCYALVHAHGTGRDASAVTAWVAGVVATLALGFCALCIVLARRELKRWWRPTVSVAGVALLAVVALRLG